MDIAVGDTILTRKKHPCGAASFEVLRVGMDFRIRCTDHRIGLTVHNLDKIMDGNLDEIIDALAMREQAEKLRQLDTQSDR